MRIELKRITVSERQSDETLCFAATIYLDGKRAGEARNAGHGGETEVYPAACESRLRAYAATLPPAEFGHGLTGTYARTAGSLVDELAYNWYNARNRAKERAAFAKALRTSLVYLTAAGEVLTSKAGLTPANIAHAVRTGFVPTWAAGGTCLNALTLDDAFARAYPTLQATE